MEAFNGLNKAVTFSYDDGCVQDKRLIELFDKYGLKCTFNLNSGLAGKGRRIPLCEISDVYKNHEIAVHTLTHPYLDKLSEDEVITEIEEDRKTLQSFVDYEIIGMAYPFGSSSINDEVISIVKKNTPIKYSRSTHPTRNFDIQDNLLDFRPTIHHNKFEVLFELAEKFINLKSDKPQIFYVWGHSYEFDDDGGKCWDRFEEFCKLISNREDIFYGTNKEVLL